MYVFWLQFADFDNLHKVFLRTIQTDPLTSSTSAIVTLAARAIKGLKLRAAALKRKAHIYCNVAA